MDGTFYIMRKPNILVTNEDKNELEELIKKTMIQWRTLNLSVTVKAHIFETHLLEQFLKYNGLGDLIEEFIEYQHKTTKDHQQRLGAIKDFQQQSNAISHLQHLANLPEVRAEKQKVAEASKGNLKRTKEGRDSKKEEGKKAKREEASKKRAEIIAETNSCATFGQSIPTIEERFREEHIRLRGGTENPPPE